MGQVATAVGTFTSTLSPGLRSGDQVSLMIRPEDGVVQANDAENPRQRGPRRGQLRGLFVGEMLDCTLALPGLDMRIKVHPSTPLTVGEPVAVHVPPERCHAIAGAG